MTQGMPPRLLLETSAAPTYLKSEPGSDEVERLLEVAENGHIRVDMARTSWDETREPSDAGRRPRLARSRGCVRVVGNVARLGAWRPGLDMLGSEVAPGIERDLPQRMLQPDRDRFLVHQSAGYDFLVTADRAFTQHQTTARISQPLRLKVGNAGDALRFLPILGVEDT